MENRFGKIVVEDSFVVVGCIEDNWVVVWCCMLEVDNAGFLECCGCCGVVAGKCYCCKVDERNKEIGRLKVVG